MWAGALALACQHERLRLEFYIDWGAQQSMKIGATCSCSLRFSTNIPALMKKKWGGATAEADGKASVPQELELAARDQPDCSGSVTVCWVSHLRWPPLPPTRSASSSFNSILSLSSVLVLHIRLWRDVWSWRDNKTTAAVVANNDRNDARPAKTIWGHVEMLYINWQDVGINGMT